MGLYDVVTQRSSDESADNPYRALLPSADEAVGYSLAKQDALLGVPFIIVGVTIRDGVKRQTKSGKVPTNYLSLEILVGDAESIARAVSRGLVSQEQLKHIDPLERVVINDGSTGIARQVIAYLHSKELIEVPEGPHDGPAGESRWDIHRSEWVKPNHATDPEPRFNIALHCPRGFRVSEYEADGQTSRTYYIA